LLGIALVLSIGEFLLEVLQLALLGTDRGLLGNIIVKVATNSGSGQIVVEIILALTTVVKTFEVAVKERLGVDCKPCLGEMWERWINVVRGRGILCDLEVEAIGIVVEKEDGILVSVVPNRIGSESLLLEGLFVRFIFPLGILLGSVLRVIVMKRSSLIDGRRR